MWLLTRLSLAGLALSATISGQAQQTTPSGLSSRDWASIEAAYMAGRHGVDPVAQQAYLKASNTDRDDRFGDAVAVSGDTVVVGAPFESSDASGVGGDQGNNNLRMAGAAYVFVRTGESWRQEAYLKPSNPGLRDWFGSAVAVSGDTIVVGAFDENSSATGVDGDQDDNSLFRAGAAYVFVRNGSTWSQQAYLKASNTDSSDSFGSVLAISGDTIVVAAPFEDSSATGVDGAQDDDSAPDSGAAYVFVRNGSTWSQQAYLKASNTGAEDFFGVVAIDGDRIVVGAVGEASSAIGVNGDEGDDSAPDAGAAYVFVRNGSTWSQEAYLKASNTDAGDVFGNVALSRDTLVVGAFGEGSNATGVNGDQADNSSPSSGAVYVFVRNDAGWSQEAYLKASNADDLDRFGLGIALDGDAIVVAAPFEDSNATGVDGNQLDNSAPEAGAAYLFVRESSGWRQEAYLKASNAEANDLLGCMVGLSGDTIVIGAEGEDSHSAGVDGDQGDNSADLAGAAYVYASKAKACVVLDFEVEDDFETSLVNGQDISTPPEFGNLVAISADGSGHYGPAIFDSDPDGPNASGGDRDLLVDRGNILILQEDPTQTVPGIFDHPDDPWFGGTLIFDFTTPVELRSVDLIDICPGPPVQDVTLTLTDQELRLRTYFVPGGWTGDVASTGPPGFGTLDLTTLEPQPGFQTTATASEDRGFDASGVIGFEVFFLSSGGLDNLELCPQSAGLRPVRKRMRFPVPVRGPRRK